MRYQIGSFRLDVQARILTFEESELPIRPRTLTLLLYLAERQGQIISKQELLSCVWEDVIVDDGVVFQSISEIRKLFNDPKIILNYPRRGYEFTQPLIPVENEKSKTSLTLPKAKWWLWASIAILLVFIASFFGEKATKEAGYDQTIVVLPVKNKVPYLENNWIYLGGMEHLIAKLDGLPKTIFIHKGTSIPHLMYVAGLKRDYQSNNVSKLFSSSAATLVVESEVYGDSHDYKLVYKLHFVDDIKEGVILDNTIEDALNKLSQKIADVLNKPLEKSSNAPSKEFNDALFAKAITTYEYDWYSSISFFESYLQLNPDSVIARIYLAKLYLWHNRAEDAQVIIDQTDKLAIISHDDVVHLKLIQGLIAAKKQQWQQATELLKTAQTISKEDTDLILKARILEELGNVYADQGKLSAGVEAFDQALGLYKIINSPTGINSARIELALLYFKLGDVKQAKLTIEQAKSAIEKVKLHFLYDRLAAAEALIN